MNNNSNNSINNNNKNLYAHRNSIRMYTRTYIFDPNERAKLRNVVVDMFGSACVFIYRQIRQVWSPVGCENHDRDEKRSHDLFPLAEVNTTVTRIKFGLPVANCDFK